MKPRLALVDTPRGEIIAAAPKIVPAEPNPATAYLLALSPASRRTMRHGLKVIVAIVCGDAHSVESFPWHELGRQHVDAIRAALAERYSPGSANLFLCALRGVIRKAWELDLISAETRERVCSFKPVKGDAENDDDARGRHLTERELDRLFDATNRDKTNVGRRDAALLAVLIGGGLRRAEIVALTMADLTISEDRTALRVQGKGQRIRTVYVGNEANEALSIWLKVRGSDPGPVFLAVKQGGAIQRHGLSTSAIFGRVQILKRRAKIKGRLSPHDCRRTYAGRALDAGVDLSVLQRMMGHASVSTTSRYDARPAAAKRAAAMRMRLPFHRPE